MKIVVNTFGTAGDVNPFLAVPRAMAAQSHEPVLALNPACEGAPRANERPFGVGLGGPADLR